ncbi:MAG: 3,4-dihydroxy-2-butanone-4-phosphate synthase, partial [Salinispira sp.]
MIDKTDMKAVLNELKDGRMIIVTDDEDRENEGDLLMAASCVRARDVNFMAKYGRGLICQAITAERARALGLHAMAPDNNAALSTAFTVSVDARGTTSTGISAADRAATVRTIIRPDTKPDDLLRPGHIFPLIAHEKGVLGRRGHTEAGVDLARMAGLQPSALICEIMDDDGTMARGDRLKELAAEWGVAMVSIQDIIDFRLRNELKRVAETRLPTDYGDFHLIAYEPEAFALIKKTPAGVASVADSSPENAAKGSP